MEDNTPLLVAVSVARARRRRKVDRFVREMLSEAYDEDAMNMTNPEVTGAGLPTDMAVFYYPGIDTGILVYGPYNSVDDMLAQFFHETLPSILPETAELKKSSVSVITNKALSRGMIVLFGKGDKLEQVMSRRGDIRLPDGGRVAEDTFNSAQSALIHFTAYATPRPNLISIKDLVPELKWLAV